MDRDKEILKLKEQGKTLKFIGLKYGITTERVRQICVKMGMRYTRYYEKGLNEDATLNAIKSKSTYPSNAVCINADGHMVFVTDGNNNWVQIYNKKLKQSIAEIYNLQSWIQEE